MIGGAEELAPRAAGPARIETSEQGQVLRAILDGDRVLEFPALQLRDLCACDACRHPSGQRLIDLAALPQDQRILSATLDRKKQTVAVLLDPEAHQVEIPLQTLLKKAASSRDFEAGRVASVVLWDSSLPATSFPVAQLTEIETDRRALAHWLRGVRDLGFGLLRGCGSEAGTVVRVVELFGYPRETNYGRLFDVVAKPDPNNLAYTGLGLGLHTDNPYRDPVPGLQFLHCMEAGGEGGDSLLVDGFRVARDLEAAYPDAFAILCKTVVPFRFADGAADLRSTAPLIESETGGGLKAIRYNNRSRDDLSLPADRLKSFYRAYTLFGRMLHDPAYSISFRMGAGDLFVVDNRRVLHGRTAFTGGRRRLQGCYADWDALTSFVNLHAGEQG